MPTRETSVAAGVGARPRRLEHHPRADEDVVLGEHAVRMAKLKTGGRGWPVIGPFPALSEDPFVGRRAAAEVMRPRHASTFGKRARHGVDHRRRSALEKKWIGLSWLPTALT
jgi:hypothetical protein